MLIWTRFAKNKQKTWGYSFDHVERSVEECLAKGEIIKSLAKTGKRSNTVLKKHGQLLVRFVREKDAYKIIDINFKGLTKKDLDNYAQIGIDKDFLDNFNGLVPTGM